MSFFLARCCRAFVLAKGDRHGANKNEIAIFVFSVTAKDFSHGVLLDGKGAIRFASEALPAQAGWARGTLEQHSHDSWWRLDCLAGDGSENWVVSQFDCGKAAKAAGS